MNYMYACSYLTKILNNIGISLPNVLNQVPRNFEYHNNYWPH